MSKEKVGALLIFERSMPLDEYFKTGTIVDAKVSDQLLRNLFFKNSPLHDGAVIVRGRSDRSIIKYLNQIKFLYNSEKTNCVYNQENYQQLKCTCLRPVEDYFVYFGKTRSV